MKGGMEGGITEERGKCQPEHMLSSAAAVNSVFPLFTSSTEVFKHSTTPAETQREWEGRREPKR